MSEIESQKAEVRNQNDLSPEASGSKFIVSVEEARSPLLPVTGKTTGEKSKARPATEAA
jgi:hypothetical protein